MSYSPPPPGPTHKGKGLVTFKRFLVFRTSNLIGPCDLLSNFDLSVWVESSLDIQSSLPRCMSGVCFSNLILIFKSKPKKSLEKTRPFPLWVGLETKLLCFTIFLMLRLNFFTYCACIYIVDIVPVDYYLQRCFSKGTLG